MAGFAGAGFSGIGFSGAGAASAAGAGADTGGVATGGIGRHCGGTGGGIATGAAAGAATTGSGAAGATGACWDVPQNGQYATLTGSALPHAGLIQRLFTGSSTFLPFWTSIVTNAAANAVARSRLRSLAILPYGCVYTARRQRSRDI